MNIKEFTVRKQNYNSSTFKVVGCCVVFSNGEITFTPGTFINSVIEEEVKNSVKYLLAEKAAVSVQTISGYQVERI